MNRRDFIKTVISASVFTPLALDIERRVHPYDLYVISDAPHAHLPALLGELSKRSLPVHRRFCFSTPHPFSNEITRALQNRGLSITDRPSASSFGVSHLPLNPKALPSFSLLHNGKIEDVRSAALSDKWESMRKGALLSSCLTIASFGPPKTSRAPGSTINVVHNGKKIEGLNLKDHTSRAFSVEGGSISIRIDGGRAWIERAPCDHKICASTSPVSFPGERILCAPCRFFIEVTGNRVFDTLIG